MSVILTRLLFTHSLHFNFSLIPPFIYSVFLHHLSKHRILLISSTSSPVFKRQIRHFSHPDICMFLSVCPVLKELFVAYCTLFSLHSSSSYLLSFLFSLFFLSLLHFCFLLLLSLSFESAAHQSYNLNSVRALVPPQHFCREREREDRGKKEHKQWRNRRRESP